MEKCINDSTEKYALTTAPIFVSLSPFSLLSPSLRVQYMPCQFLSCRVPLSFLATCPLLRSVLQSRLTVCFFHLFAFACMFFYYYYYSFDLFLFHRSPSFHFLFVYSACRVSSCRAACRCYFLSRVLSSVACCSRAPPFVLFFSSVRICLHACSFAFFYSFDLFVCICSSLSPLLAQICPCPSLPLPPDIKLLLLSPCEYCYISPSPTSHNSPFSRHTNFLLFSSLPPYKFVPLSLVA